MQRAAAAAASLCRRLPFSLTVVKLPPPLPSQQDNFSSAALMPFRVANRLLHLSSLAPLLQPLLTFSTLSDFETKSAAAAWIQTDVQKKKKKKKKMKKKKKNIHGMVWYGIRKDQRERKR
jgi:hypothetical protein